MFRGISVLLNKPDPRSGALACASEWASRLRLPLRQLEWPTPVSMPSEERWPRLGAAPLSFDVGVQQLFLPFELCVFEHELPSAFKKMLLARLVRSSQTSALICPPTWRPVSRVLVLNQHRRPSDGFLDTAAGVCRTLQATPIVLTVAPSEAEARDRERSAEEAFARRRLAVDCDFVAGCEVPTAVAQAARWRGCSHVFVEHRSISSWRRWLFGDMLRELAGLSDSLALVAISGAQPSCDRPNETTQLQRSDDEAVRRV